VAFAFTDGFIGVDTEILLRGAQIFRHSQKLNARAARPKVYSRAGANAASNLFARLSDKNHWFKTII